MGLSVQGSNAISAFSSTPRFFKDITDLSTEVVKGVNKDATLKEGLANLNQYLPASIYIPFVKNGLRNYTVLRVVPEESRLFLTKERAPFLVCFEVYRPEEIQIAA